uniref:RAB6-interacting golgin n=1 Tax=Setaria digitata TaxID=48799 RepID=A0A915PYS0_9BILA
MRDNMVTTTVAVTTTSTVSPPSVTDDRIAQFLSRRRDRAERAARAEERKNEEEKHAWYKEEIGECEKKIQYLNARKTELDEAKSKLFAELKEVVAKSKDRTQASFYSPLIQSQARNKAKNADAGSTASMGQFPADGLQNSGATVTSAYSDLQFSCGRVLMNTLNDSLFYLPLFGAVFWDNS